jgi:carboxyl-terminal processing protease
MILKVRFLICLPVILAILACSFYIPVLQQEPPPSQENKEKPLKPTALSPATHTPIPTAIPTQTVSLPSPTAILLSTSTPEATPIPLESQLRIFENLWTIVNDTYVYPDFNGLDWDAIRQEYNQKISAGLTNSQFYTTLSELVSSLGDDHSQFLNPQEVAEQESEYQGKYDYVGIGVVVSAVPERQRGVILSVFTGSPAEAAGLKPRDSIIAVDGISILDEDGFLRDIVRGPEGTSISMEVQTPGEKPREIQVSRHRITGEIPVISNVIINPQGKRIGYILLVTFDDSTVDEQIDSALQQMTKDAPLDGLILDNRMNGGGSSTVLEPVLSYFVGGNLGYFINRIEEHSLQIDLQDINGSSQVPLVVLVGSETASFGEIFAGVLQDVGRAYLIGKTTDGNVEILWGYDLEDGSKIWLANETFQPLNHPDQNWEKTGIIPDLFVAGDFDQYSLETDPAVSAAIEYLSKE